MFKYKLCNECLMSTMMYGDKIQKGKKKTLKKKLKTSQRSLGRDWQRQEEINMDQTKNQDKKYETSN